MIRFCILLALALQTSTFLAKGTGDTGQTIYINCPSDKWLYCDDLTYDLSVHGYPQVTTSHNYTVDEWDAEYHLNGCQVGYIKRKWEITDHYDYKVYYCEQKITVKAHANSITIDWPENYITYECEPDLDPSNLPDNFGYPDVSESGSCSDIYIGYKDYNLYNSSDVCHKVLREWTVIDWCVYEPNSGSTAGRWVYEQFLKIKSNEMPTILCPSDTLVGVDSDCQGAYVTLPRATGSSTCNGNIKITNDSPYAAYKGADASGFYPLGETWIKFTIDDLCGNKSHCKTKVTVKDLAGPTVICKYGISVPLSQMHDGYYTELWPMEFNQKSYDNCTNDSDLRFEISLDRVTCDNLGQNDVYLTVTDKAGNSTTCRSFVNVQDNQNLCAGSAAPYSLDGVVKSQNSIPIKDVQISLNNNTTQATMTDDQGDYLYSGLLHQQDYLIKPVKNDNTLSGISITDLIQLIWHITGKTLISDPYGLIAGDVNNSGDIDANDFHQLRDVLLGVHSEFPNNTSWRFNLEDNDLSEYDSPFQKMEESYLLENTVDNMHNLNFVGIKIGDVDGSLNSNRILSRSDQIDIKVPSIYLEKSDVLNISLASENLVGETGILDIAMNYNPDILEFIRIDGIDESSTFEPEAMISNSGAIRYVAYGDLSNVILVFRAKSAGYSHESISYQDIGKIVLNSDEALRGLNLSIETKTLLPVDMSINPNPFNDYFELEINSELNTESEFALFDVRGRLLHSATVNLEKGLNRFLFDTDVVAIRNFNGVLIYKLITPNGVISGQLIKTE